MPYAREYDVIYNESFQIEITDDEAARIDWAGGPARSSVSGAPWPNLPIRSRHRSERHPEGEWHKYTSKEEYDEAHKNGPCSSDCPLTKENSPVKLTE